MTEQKSCKIENLFEEIKHNYILKIDFIRFCKSEYENDDKIIDAKNTDYDILIFNSNYNGYLFFTNYLNIYYREDDYKNNFITSFTFSSFNFDKELVNLSFLQCMYIDKSLYTSLRYDLFIRKEIYTILYQNSRNKEQSEIRTKLFLLVKAPKIFNIKHIKEYGIKICIFIK